MDQTLINNIILGKNVGVGAVEALLLLSEYLPRQTDVVASKLNAEENRMSWMLVGTVRTSPVVFTSLWRGLMALPFFAGGPVGLHART